MNVEVEAKRIDVSQLFLKEEMPNQFVIATPPSAISARSSKSPLANSWRRPRQKLARESEDSSAAGNAAGHIICTSTYVQLHSHENKCDLPQKSDQGFGELQFDDIDHESAHVQFEEKLHSQLSIHSMKMM